MIAATSGYVCVLLASVGVGVFMPAADQPAKPGDVYSKAPGAEESEPGRSALLIDDQLSARRISLVGIDGDSVVFHDEAGRRRRAVIDTLMALVPAPETVDAQGGIGASSRPVSTTGRGGGSRAQTAGYRGEIVLIDGQRFPGEYAPTAGQEETIVWNHPAFGHLELPLDRVERMYRQAMAGQEAGAAPEGEVLDDELILVNGDRVRGFIIGLGDPAQVEVDDRVMEIPADRVAGAVFANSREPLTGLIVWLEDGTVAAVDSVVTVSGMNSTTVDVTLPSGQEGRYSLQSLRAIAFDGGRIVPLSSLQPREQMPGAERMFAPPIERVRHPDDLSAASSAALNAEDVLLPGPMSIEYDLPAGASRFAGTATLGPETQPWGDCELAISVDGREIWRQRLHGGQRTVPFNVRLTGRRLSITLDAGNFGPILDRVVLQRPLLLRDSGQPE